jgi:hypothetical protein
MYIRLNFGPKAGEIQFFRTDVARQLIANGRAEDPSAELRGFATGGIVSAGEPVLVGETVTGSFLPRATVEKFEKQLKAGAKAKR